MKGSTVQLTNPGKKAARRPPTPTTTYRQVSAKRQKLLGLKTKDGKLAGDDARVGDLAIKTSTKIMMMGQRDEVRVGGDDVVWGLVGGGGFR